MGAESGVFNRVRVTIGAGASLSDVADFGVRGVLVGIQMPAGWDAAGLTFQAAADGETFGNVTDSGGTERSYTAAAGQYLTVDPAEWAGVRFLKVRSGTGAAPVNQAAERIVELILRG